MEVMEISEISEISEVKENFCQLSGVDLMDVISFEALISCFLDLCL